MKRFVALLIAVVMTIGMTTGALAQGPGTRRGGMARTPSGDASQAEGGTAGSAGGAEQSSSQAGGAATQQPVTPGMTLVSGTPASLEAGSTVVLSVPIPAGTATPATLTVTLGGTLATAFEAPATLSVVAGATAASLTLKVKDGAAAGSYSGAVSASTASGVLASYALSATVKEPVQSEPDPVPPVREPDPQPSQQESSREESASSRPSGQSNADNSTSSASSAGELGNSANNGNDGAGESSQASRPEPTPPTPPTQPAQPATFFVSGAGDKISGSTSINENGAVRITVGGDVYTDGSERVLSGGDVSVNMLGGSRFDLGFEGNVAVLTPKADAPAGDYTVRLVLQNGGEKVVGTVNITLTRTVQVTPTPGKVDPSDFAPPPGSDNSLTVETYPPVDNNSSKLDSSSSSEPDSSSSSEPESSASSEPESSSSSEPETPSASSSEPETSSSSEPEQQKPAEPVSLKEGVGLITDNGDGYKIYYAGSKIEYSLSSDKFNNADKNSDIVAEVLKGMQIHMTVGGNSVSLDNYFVSEIIPANGSSPAKVSLTVKSSLSKVTLKNVDIWVSIPNPNGGAAIASAPVNYTTLELGGSAASPASLANIITGFSATGTLNGNVPTDPDKIYQHSKLVASLTIPYGLFTADTALDGLGNDYKLINDLLKGDGVTSDKLEVTLSGGPNVGYLTPTLVSTGTSSAPSIQITANIATSEVKLTNEPVAVVLTLRGPNINGNTTSFTTPNYSLSGTLMSTAAYNNLYNAPGSGSKINGLNSGGDIYSLGTFKYNNNNVSDFDGIDLKPDDHLKVYLVGGMFTWSGTAPGRDYKVTTSQLRTGKITLRRTASKGSDLLDSLELKSDSNGSYISVQFVDEFVSVNDKDVSLTVYLMYNNKRDNDYAFTIDGTMSNGEYLELYSDDDYADLSDGVIARANDYIRNIELYLGNGVTMKTNLFSGRKYYGVASNSLTSADERVINTYPEIEYIVSLKTINLSSTGGRKSVSFDLDDYYYVYDEDGAYVGRSNETLAYSGKYYFASKRVTSLDVGSGSGSGSGGSNVIEDSGDGAGSGSGSGSSSSGSGAQPGITDNGSGGSAGGSGSGSGISGGNANDNAATGGWLLTPCNALNAAQTSVEVAQAAAQAARQE